MGIGLNSLLLITRALPGIGDLSDKKMLTLGLQDCHFTYNEVLAFLAKHSIPHRHLTEGEVRLTTGFKWLPPKEAEEYRNCIHQETLFRLLGFAPENIHALDANDFEGADVIHDLNVSIDDGLVGRFDFIFDGGTIEHVFSVKDSLFNTARMCKVGGLVVHISPVDYLNHGLINFNPGLFRDFYLANGFEEVKVLVLGLPIAPRRAARFFLEFDPEDLDFSLRQKYATMVFASFRKADDRALVVPQQSSYMGLWGGGEREGDGPVGRGTEVGGPGWGQISRLLARAGGGSGHRSPRENEAGEASGPLRRSSRPGVTRS
jgi:hypothetical protein